MNTLAVSLLLGCAGVLLAWLLRRPARRVVGAGPAFWLWLLPPALAAAAWLPTWPAVATHAAMRLTLPTLMVNASGTATASPVGVDLVHLAFMLWLAGAGLMLVRLVMHGWRIVHRSRPLPDGLRTALEPDLAALDARAIRVHPAGPAVCWLPHCRLLLPAGFLARFDADQRSQVLAHERMHLLRRDPLWSLLAELVLAALWFFPPAWLAMSRFHLDQELACDAAIIDRAPAEAGAYARALLSSATTPRALAVTTAWLSRPRLKERLTMIQLHSHTLLHRRAGYTLLAAVLAATSIAAYAVMPATQHAGMPPVTAAPTSTRAPLLVPLPAARPQATTRAADATSIGIGAPMVTQSPPAPHPTARQSSASHPVSVDVSYRMTHPPRYPAEAIKQHQQGTVVLNVHVSADGMPIGITYDPKATHASTALISAAIEGAARWRFNPAYKAGKPVAGWVRTPVRFELGGAAQKSTQPADHSSVN